MALVPLSPKQDMGHLRAALAWVSDFSLAVDGGAGIGTATRALLREFGCVHAFEPLPTNASEVGAHDRLTLHPYALSDAPGPLWLVPGLKNEGQWHVAEHGCDGTSVEAVRLDDIELPSCGLLKLDVEGYEMRALKGATVTIATHRPVIVVEENGLCERYGINRAEPGAWLRGMGYDRILVVGEDEVWLPR